MRRTASQVGLREDQWTTAKHEVRDAIVGAAHDRRLTSYGEVAAQVRVIQVDPASPLMQELLGGVFEDEYDAGGPALTAIVTYQYSDQEPAQSFYSEARTLGYRFSEPHAFWTEQVQRVFSEHGRHDRRR
ncbi:hypothetical protein ACFPIJ_40265 [Dactylosporangium cerinum]|uniref:Uncharacterized protein n=1 Tax=Dactylosporangium cerinum TaxID=1434730 RepID=A0ABV9W7R9_9ACTN